MNMRLLVVWISPTDAPGGGGVRSNPLAAEIAQRAAAAG